MLVTLTISIIFALLSAIVVMIHCEALYWSSRMIKPIPVRHYYQLIISIMSVLAAHILEIFIFALGYYILINYFGTESGSLVIVAEEDTRSMSGLSSCIYYSFITYTTLGFGDIIPTGMLRFLTGLESLMGLVLIAWSASFLYKRMPEYRETNV